MKSLMGAASLAIGLVTMALIISYVYYDIKNLAPGELSAVHSQVPELNGTGSCVACHGNADRTMGASCLDCHPAIGQQLGERAGVHGKLTATQRERCWDCHSEHHGSEFAPTNRRSFELAGIVEPANFDHAGLGYQLSGIHLELSCEKCHPAAFQAVLEPGATRFLGLSQNCLQCHQDTHKGTLGNDCASCHGQSHPFPQAEKFEHTAQFPLQGSHAKKACQTCHVPNTPWAVVELLQLRNQSESAPIAIRSCVDCHASPHNSQFIALVANRLEMDPGNSCQACHIEEHKSFSRPEAAIDNALHEFTGFSLTHPHHELACEACHGEPNLESGSPISFGRRFPDRNPDDCRACHGDPHQGEFAAGTQSTQTCLDCHDRKSFSPSTFDMNRHDTTQFPIRGAHRDLSCRTCHRNDLRVTDSKHSPIPSFEGLPLTCAGCHSDPHFDQFDSGDLPGTNCQACHTEKTFRRTTFDERMHSETRFPLDGAHIAVSCRECHPDMPESEREQLQRSSPESLLVARRFRGISTKCESCHVDAHKGMFDQSDGPVETKRTADCSQCHSTKSFREIKDASFDHSHWARFELAGAHAALECGQCHGRSAKPNELGRTLGLAPGRKCQDCHRDPHVGQFGAAEEVDCAKCHTESSFQELRFDHQRHSAFALDAQHRQLDCAACHRVYRLSDGQLVTRYKPIGTACSDCHLPRNDNLRRRP